jgi:hypothetical protein
MPTALRLNFIGQLVGQIENLVRDPLGPDRLALVATSVLAVWPLREIPTVLDCRLDPLREQDAVSDAEAVRGARALYVVSVAAL